MLHMFTRVLREKERASTRHVQARFVTAIRSPKDIPDAFLLVDLQLVKAYPRLYTQN